MRSFPSGRSASARVRHLAPRRRSKCLLCLLILRAGCRPRSVLVAPAIEIRRQETEFGAGFSPRCRTSFSGEENNGIDEASRCGSMGRPTVNEGRTALNPEPNKPRPIRPAFFAGHEYLGPNSPRHRFERARPAGQAFC